MDQETKIWLGFWTFLAVLLTVVIVFCLFFDYKKEIRMAELGFQRVTIVGTSSSVYHKTQ